MRLFVKVECFPAVRFCFLEGNRKQINFDYVVHSTNISWESLESVIIFMESFV